MKYGPRECLFGALVFDVDRIERLDQVISVDTDAGEVICCHKPIRIVDGVVAQYPIKFRSIYAIRGLDQLPGLFHCYGRSGQTPPSGAEGVVA